MMSACLQAILIFNIVEFTPLSYGDYVLPRWSQVVGWMMAVASVAMIPIFAVYQFIVLSPRPPYSQLRFCPVNVTLRNEQKR